MSFEQNRTQTEHPPRHEYFEHAETLEEVFLAYERNADLLVKGHQEQFVSIAPDHERAFAGEAQHPGSWHIDRVMKRTEDCVVSAVEMHKPHIESLIDQASETASSMLGFRERAILAKYRDELSMYGLGLRTAKTLDEARPTSLPLLKMALDADILRTVQTQAQNYGADATMIEKTLDQASTKPVRAAMKASLDGAILNKANQQAKDYGADATLIDKTLQAASSQSVSEAIKASLDSKVLQKAGQNAHDYGVDNPLVSRSLGHASSPRVTSVFARKFIFGGAPQGNASATGPGRHEAPRTNLFGDDSESIFGAVFRDGVFGEGSAFRQRSEQRRAYPPPRKESPRRQNPPREDPKPEPKPAPIPEEPPKIDAEVASIVAHTVAENKQFRWLSGEDPQAVRRVINTVRKIRANAEARGSDISDKDIYKIYRLASDHGDQRSRDPSQRYENRADPATIKSYKILEALMGGDYRGKLPF